MIEGVLFAPYKCDNIQQFCTRLMILVGKQYPNTEKDKLFVITELKKILLLIDSTSFHAQIHMLPALWL